MEPDPELIASIYREKVERARRLSIDQKFRDGLELFDLVCRIMADGVRMQHPQATEDEVHRHVLARLDLLDRRDRLEGAA